MGILNVTPDSFSDGRLPRPRAAPSNGVPHLVDRGGRSLDVGGESSSPGAAPVAEADRAPSGASGDLGPRPPSPAGPVGGHGEAGGGRGGLGGRGPAERHLGTLWRWRAQPAPAGWRCTAGNPADDAGRPPLRRRGDRGPAFLLTRPRGRAPVSSEVLGRPGDRLREDRRAQLEPLGPPRRARLAGRVRSRLSPAGGWEPHASSSWVCSLRSVGRDKPVPAAKRLDALAGHGRWRPWWQGADDGPRPRRGRGPYGRRPAPLRRDRWRREGQVGGGHPASPPDLGAATSAWRPASDPAARAPANHRRVRRKEEIIWLG